MQEKMETGMIEQLFGVQSTEAYSKYINTRTGTRSQPRKGSVTRGRSLKIVDYHGSMTVDEVANFELKNMRQAELQQTKVDKFWGLDKEKFDSMHELIVMSFEDERSHKLRNFIRKEQLIRNWQEEEKKKLKDQSDNIREQQAREDYMNFFYETKSSGSILKYSWPTREHVTSTIGDNQLNERTLGFDINIIDATISTIHNEGLQQSRNISTAGSKFQSRKSSYNDTFTGGAPSPIPMTRPLSSSLFSPEEVDDVESFSSNGSFQIVGSPSKYSPSKFSSYAAKKSNFLSEAGSKYMRETNRVILSELEPRYIEDLDGHPVQKWSQEGIFRKVFGILDVSGSGKVYRTEIPMLSESFEIHSYLKFTIFWMKIKRRDWGFFYRIFNTENDYFTVTEWLHAAKDLATASHVKIFPKNLRLDSEHRKIVLEAGNWTPNLQRDPRQTFAVQTRSKVDSLEREVMLRRCLQVGDFVWGQCDGGYIWLPALIAAIHEDGRYTLNFILTMEEFRSAQSATNSRHLLAKGPPNFEKLCEKKSDREVCDYIFTCLDQEGNGLIKCLDLITALSSPDLRTVVNSSLALSRLIYGGSHYLDTFKKLVGEDEFVTKFDFVEICSVLVELSSYQ